MSETHEQQPATVDLAALLAMPTDQIERPRALPPGHYIGRIISKEMDRSRQKQTPYLRLHLGVDAPASDVVESLDGITLSRVELRMDHFITVKSVGRVANMDDAVLGPAVGRGLQERFEELIGAKVMFLVTRPTNDDGVETGYNNVLSIIAAPPA